MKLKLVEIFNMSEALTKLIRQDLPIKTAWKLKKLVSKLNEEYAQIESVRIDLVNKYGEKTEDGKTSVKKEEIKKFTEELNELLQEEVEMEFTPINISELGDNCVLSAADISSLEKVIID